MTNNNKSSTVTTKPTNRTKSSRRTRVTHTRVQKVKVTTLGKPTSTSEKQPPFRTCVRCKESSNNVKLLSARVGRIEQLVNELAKTTENFSKKRKESCSSTNTTWKFGNIDLKTCSLEELQKLVISTTNMMIPPKPTIASKFHSEPMELPSSGSSVKTVVQQLDYNTRKDSGFEESKPSEVAIRVHHNNNTAS